MKNLKRKINCALTLSAMSLIIVIAIIGLWMFKSQEIVVVTLDTFIGVIVALLAIIVTIAIGWQIYAAMDLKSNIAKLDERINEVENIKKQLEEQNILSRQLHNKAQHFSHIAIGEICLNKGEFLNAIRFYLSALKFGLSLAEPLNLKEAIHSIMTCIDNIDIYVESPSIKLKNSILTNDKYIRESRMFKSIQEEYEEVFAKLKTKVNFDDAK